MSCPSRLARRLARCACSPSLFTGLDIAGEGDNEDGDCADSADGAGEFANVEGNEKESIPTFDVEGNGGGDCDCPNVAGANGLLDPNPVGCGKSGWAAGSSCCICCCC